MNTAERLKQINDERALKASSEARHDELVLSNIQTQETIGKSFRMLLDYLDNKATKTEVVNQLSEVGTPDVAHVVSAIRSLHETLATHENTDLTEITSILREVLKQTEQIPKSLPKEKEQQFIDYTNQLSSLKAAIESVEKVVKAQKLVAEAPVVNVPTPNVNVDAPDLSPLKDAMQDVVKAVKAIVIPEYKTDNKELEKILKRTNSLLLELLDKPTGGGGGGGRVSPYQDVNNVPAFVTLNSDGSIPTGGFDPSRNLTTDISTPGIIIETDGIRTLTTTITDTEITEVWS